MTSPTETEFAEFDAKNLWNEVYQRLKNEASLASMGAEFTTKVARDPDNRRKNRYRDVSPYDHSRVLLSGNNNYINASHVEVPEINRKYILTQGPLEHTMDDFWRMVWEQESKAIVMLNRIVEKGAVKCCQYWPLGADYGNTQVMNFTECGLRVTLLSEQDFQHFTLRALEVENLESDEKRDILHFHYTTWPDFGVPSSPNAFLYFLNCVRETGCLEADVGPAIIHCSAGIGRSGTFCLVDSCLVMVENSGSLRNVNVRKTLIQMRSFRMGLIQTPDQLRFSYLAIIKGAHAILNGSGIANIQVSSSTLNEKMSVGKPSRNHPAEHADTIDTLLVAPEEPPPLPPKKNQIHKYQYWNPCGEEEDSGDEVRNVICDKENGKVPHVKDDSDEELAELIDREEDSQDSSDECEADLRLCDYKHRVREERKKETADQIHQMKERQEKSERCRERSSLAKHSMYLGLAVAVGVAAVCIYKYFS